MSSPARAMSLGLVAAAAAVAGLVVASFVYKPDAGSAPALGAGTLLGQPRALPEFMLTGADGQPWTRTALEGGWSLIFVGFTYCPDICPTTLKLLKGVHAQLAAKKHPLQVVFLSVDPERDTPEVLGRYVSNFDPAFKGVTGPTSELDKLGAAMGFVYIKAPGRTPETYTIDHSSALILTNPQGQVAGYFTPPFKVDALVDDLSKLIPAAS